MEAKPFLLLGATIQKHLKKKYFYNILPLPLTGQSKSK
jgi:hypothetical protein